ncbi:hypothetical protein [Nocardioides aurantiacus]|uniref:Uncharacterized protein n=1 Tax=Nocardioides aurantiacus TaxID=86796 RepID=A0A3N2CQI5_9ACTN|nr:hypothetical protein [Nocardioides aurantiacus]ROR89785.1 hypothetical protein EDD33_0615 [Nocardioides aurantiacus]
MSRTQLDALLAESVDGLDAVDRDHLREELGSLLSLVDDTPPTPSAELAELLGPPAPEAAAGPDLARVVPLRRLTGPRGAVTGAVVLAVATVGATGLSAAANSLPAPLQRQVSELSRSYLPFDFPRPRGVLDRTPTLEDLPDPESLSGVPAAPLPGTPAADDADGEARVPTTTRGGVTRGPQQVAARDDARLGAAPRSSTVTVRPTASPSPSASPSGTRARHDDAPRPRREQAGDGAAAPDGATGPRTRGPAVASASASPAPSPAAAPAPAAAPTAAPAPAAAPTPAAPDQEPDRPPTTSSDRGRGAQGTGSKGPESSADKGSGKGAPRSDEGRADGQPDRSTEPRDATGPTSVLGRSAQLLDRVTGTTG